MASQAIRSQTCTQILHPMHSSNRICTFGMTTLIPSDVSRGVSSIQSTGQKLTHASHPVQLSGMTTASSFGFFFLRVILAGASGIIRVGFAFFGSYATGQYSHKKAQNSQNVSDLGSIFDGLLLPFCGHVFSLPILDMLRFGLSIVREHCWAC